MTFFSPPADAADGTSACGKHIRVNPAELVGANAVAVTNVRRYREDGQ